MVLVSAPPRSGDQGRSRCYAMTPPTSALADTAADVSRVKTSLDATCMSVDVRALASSFRA